MRYFLDTEFNGFGGELISLALVPADGSEELYLTFANEAPIDPWVERHVLPYLDHVPDHLRLPKVRRAEAAAAVAMYLGADRDPEILADWPTDIELFCGLLSFAPGQIVPIPETRFRLLTLANFSTAENSAVPHNALHDARALRAHVLGLEP
ncbi:MAG TPA: hypothetical protein VNH53_02025 [Sphingomicrobium sp.]|nr:hypothetical protein [Sphingomicrobium sp.]